MGVDLRRRFRPEGGPAFNLAGVDPSDHPGVDGEDEAEAELYRLADRLFDLHEIMMAHAERSLLLVMQGTDASGKSGTIKHVVRHVNPGGVTVARFVEPTQEEEQHHFLWRIEHELPSPGRLGVFDRSHYEDLLVPVVDGELADDEIDSRFRHVVEFEEKLAESGVAIAKCFTHISYDEQRRRFLRRLRRHDKRWKFKPADLEVRRKWDDYQAAYADAIIRTDADHAPWYVIPSDHKWYRNWAVARILVDTLGDMYDDYPEPGFDTEHLRAQLQPPL